MPQGEPVSMQPTDAADKNFAALYRMLTAVFAGLLLVNLGLWFLLSWQTKQVRAQLAQNRQAIARYHQVEEPVIKDMLNKLESFGLQNRDYQPLLQKYPGLFPRFQTTGAGAGLKTPAFPATSPSTLPAPISK
ncbi:MAG: hypothetical protein NTW03_09640 [Verrucomicrobia bacterium]|nr:hypothetical protein [Verrucomicrobiota bacterium]